MGFSFGEIANGYKAWGMQSFNYGGQLQVFLLAMLKNRLLYSNTCAIA